MKRFLGYAGASLLVVAFMGAVILLRRRDSPVLSGSTSGDSSTHADAPYSRKTDWKQLTILALDETGRPLKACRLHVVGAEPARVDTDSRGEARTRVRTHQERVRVLGAFVEASSKYLWRDCSFDVRTDLAIEFRFLELSTVEGLVVGEAGLPLPAQEVELSIGHNSDVGSEDQRIFAELTQSGGLNLRSDRSGRFRIAGVSPEFILRFVARGWGNRAQGRILTNLAVRPGGLFHEAPTLGTYFVTLSLARSHRLTIVVEGDKASRLEGAVVSCDVERPGMAATSGDRMTGTTDAEGQCVFELKLREGEDEASLSGRRLWVLVIKEGAGTARYHGRFDTRSPFLLLRPQQAGTPVIRGQVVDSISRIGIGGVVVQLRSSATGSADLASCVTDSSGRFAAAGIPEPGVDWLDVYPNGVKYEAHLDPPKDKPEYVGTARAIPLDPNVENLVPLQRDPRK